MDQLLEFSDLRIGMKAEVVQVDENAEFCGRLMELGLTPGAEIVVTKVAPLGDPVEISVRGSKLCLRKSECCCLRVRRIV